jgi:hypothetical protein
VLGLLLFLEEKARREEERVGKKKGELGEENFLFLLRIRL